ncbi:transcription factor HHO2-like [Salvia splendens]|uniref:transcription factor HHO2-like n=1 Tax=Salvia splendens TaxID=180675 RepID=UPI001C27A956|nr:transcription factor HHO2-like [Salvia splendens]
MVSLIHPELGLESRFSTKSWLPKPIGRFLADVSQNRCISDKILQLDGFVNQLLDEMKKIDAFKCELPLCMLIITDAIMIVQEELSLCKNLKSEPVLEEFIPIKTDDNDKAKDRKDKEISSRDKKSWMSCVQLWNSDDQNAADYKTKDALSESEKKKKKKKVMKDMDELPPVPRLSLCTPGIKNSINPIGRSSSPPANSNLQPSFKETARKQRRCWSPDLHRQFVNALQHLGGPQAATPKQIREHMQVDGLTNDEVKSHLQKYRLHMRKIANKSPLWASQEQFGEHSNGSPEGPLHLSRCPESDTLDDEDGE